MTAPATETGQLSAEDAAIAAQLGIGTGDPGVETEQGQESGTDEGQQEQGQEPSGFDALPEETKAEIRRLRSENARQRIELRKTQGKQKSEAAPAEGAQETPAQIEARVRESVRQEYGVRLATADVTAALKGVVPDSLLPQVVGTLDLSQYVTEEGTDTEAVAALRDQYVALLGTSKKPTARVGHQKQGTGQTAKSNGELFGEALAQFL